MEVTKKPLMELNKDEFYEALLLMNEKTSQRISDGEVTQVALQFGQITQAKAREFLKGN